jgi:hypothetical protein
MTVELCDLHFLFKFHSKVKNIFKYIVETILSLSCPFKVWAVAVGSMVHTYQYDGGCAIAFAISLT